MKNILFVLLFPYILFSQNKVGNNINGEAIGDESGSSLSLSSNGSTIAVGAYLNNGSGSSSGHVRVYINENGTWTQIGSDIDGEAAGDESGSSLSLSSDGSIIAIGSKFNNGSGSSSGHVRVYKNEDGTWTQIGSDIDGEAAGDYSGFSVALSSDGSIMAIGAARNSNDNGVSGHVRVYKNEDGTWTQKGSDIDGEAAADNSGISVSLSSDGSIVAVGAPGNDGNGNSSGHVRVYKDNNGIWTQKGSDIDGEAAGDYSGISVSLSSDGSIVAIGARSNDGNGSGSGHVRVYKYENVTWNQIGSDIDGEAAGDGSGTSISLSSDGSIIAISAHLNDGNGMDTGHVRIYRNVNGEWTQIGSDIDGEAVEDYSGSNGFSPLIGGPSVSLSSNGSVLAIGALGNDDNGIDSGHVRVYDLSAVLSTQSFNVDYFSMYPNPIKNKVELKLKDNQKLKKVNIYTTLGKYLYSEKSLNIDISHLSSGLYVLEVETNQGKSAKKIVKK